MTRSETEIRRKIDAARVAASILKANGHVFEAEQVLTLCRSALSLHETARRLHADAMKLRETKP